jgi:hypothetical protein
MRGLLAYWPEMAYNQHPEETGGASSRGTHWGDDYKS